MNYAKINLKDIANGPGVRVSLFVSGCNNHCPGCFNPETWKFNYGDEFTEEVEDKIIEEMRPKYIRGLTILGGEPLDESNIFTVSNFLHKVRSVYGQRKDIWLYTGYILKQLTNKKSIYYNPEIFNVIYTLDAIVDGPFREDQKDISLAFKGSKNQRIIDAQYYNETKKIREYKY